MLQDLPEDILLIIAKNLDVKSLVSMGSTCATLRRVSMHDHLGLHVTLTKRNISAGISTWMSRVARRIKSVKAKRCITMHSVPRWLENLTNADAIAAEHCRVPAHTIRMFPHGLRSVRLHMLIPPSLASDTARHFDTSILDALKCIECLSITFAPGWTHVDLGTFASSVRLHTLEIRHAPRVFISKQLPLTENASVALHACNSIIVNRHARLPPCRDISISVNNSRAPVEELLPDRLDTLRTLYVSSERRVNIDRMEEMVALEHVALELDAILLDVHALSKMTCLRTATLHARHCFAIGNTERVYDDTLDRITFRAYSGGRPFDILSFLRGR
jgi:hypothetical protein